MSVGLLFGVCVSKTLAPGIPQPFQSIIVPRSSCSSSYHPSTCLKHVYCLTNIGLLVLHERATFMDGRILVQITALVLQTSAMGAHLLRLPFRSRKLLLNPKP